MGLGAPDEKTIENEPQAKSEELQGRHPREEKELRIQPEQGWLEALDALLQANLRPEAGRWHHHYEGHGGVLRPAG